MSMNIAVEAARKLLELAWDLTLPVDVEHIAATLGVRIERRDLGIAAGRLDSQKRLNTVNDSYDHARQRLAIARQLGHLALGHGGSIRNASDFLDCFSNPQNRQAFEEQEIAAGQFAAELLMPGVAMQILIDGRGIKDARKLRQYLEVSAFDLNDRLRTLGYID